MPDGWSKLDGRSLVPLLKDAKAPTGPTARCSRTSAAGRGARRRSRSTTACPIRNSRFTPGEQQQLYDLKADPGEKKNVIDEHPQVVAELRTAYDAWWEEVLPRWRTKTHGNGPTVNTFKELYWKQFPEEKPKAGEKQKQKQKDKTS